MAEFPALPIFTDAYLADTRHLTAAQHGAYLLLLMMAWRLPDCALPSDDETLARWASMDKRTWVNNRDAVLAFWTRGDDGKFRQKRLSDERNYVEQKRNKNSAAGKASALKRHNRGSTFVQPNVNETSTPTPTPTPTEESSLRSDRRAPKRATAIPADWRPDEKGLSFAVEKGIARVDIPGVVQHFRDHHASKGNTFKDIPAAWRTWCSSPYRQRGQGPPGQQRRAGSGWLEAAADVIEEGGQNERGGQHGFGFGPDNGKPGAEQSRRQPHGQGDGDRHEVLDLSRSGPERYG